MEKKWTIKIALLYQHKGGFPGGSDDKESACNAEDLVWSLGLEWQPTPVFLPGEFQGQSSLAGYRPWPHRVGYNWATNTFTFININAMIPLCPYSIPFIKLLTTQTLLSSQIFLYIACITFWIVHSRKERFCVFLILKTIIQVTVLMILWNCCQFCPDIFFV